MTRVAGLLLALLLGGCSIGVGRRGTSGTYQQAADSHSNLCIRNPKLCEELSIGEASGLIVRQRVAEVGASVYAAAEGVRLLDKAVHRKIEQTLLECAKEADFQVNEKHFGGSPTREQCQEVLGRDTAAWRLQPEPTLPLQQEDGPLGNLESRTGGGATPCWG